MTFNPAGRGSTAKLALVTSLIALVAALGGTSYAAVELGRHTVGTKQLKDNAVTSGKVKNRALLAVDFAKGQLPAGATGPAGPEGPTGQPGPAGPTGISARGSVSQPNFSVAAGNCVPVGLGFSIASDKVLAVTPVDPPTAVSITPVISSGLARMRVCNNTAATAGPVTLVVNYVVF